MIYPDDTYIEKISKFILNEEIKSDFRISMVLSLKEELDKLDNIDKCNFFDYINNIRENLMIIEDIYLCCRDEIQDILSQDAVGCIKHMLLSEKKNMLNILVEKSEICIDVLYNCLSFIEFIFTVLTAKISPVVRFLYKSTLP